jgi:hypothetical protein
VKSALFFLSIAEFVKRAQGVSSSLSSAVFLDLKEAWCVNVSCLTDQNVISAQEGTIHFFITSGTFDLGTHLFQSVSHCSDESKMDARC